MIITISDPVLWGAFTALPFVTVFALIRRARRQQKKERQEEAEWLAWQSDRNNTH